VVVPVIRKPYVQIVGLRRFFAVIGDGRGNDASGFRVGIAQIGVERNSSEKIALSADERQIFSG